MKRIESTKNDQIKRWKKLHTRKGREKEAMFLLEGIHLVEEAVKAKVEIETVVITEQTEIPPILAELEIVHVTSQVMKELAETETPQGIIAICKQPVNEQGINDRAGAYLLIDRVQDPGNLGTMIRTADSAGIDGVILGEGCVDLYNGKVVRATQGSIFHLPIIKGELRSWVKRFKENDIPVFGTALEGACSYKEVQQQQSFALIMGNEGEGVSKELLNQTKKNVYIPILGRAESLNVAVATGILLFHLQS